MGEIKHQIRVFTVTVAVNNDDNSVRILLLFNSFNTRTSYTFPPYTMVQTDLFIGHMHGGDLEVREIYADLSDVLLLQVPPDGLAAPQASRLVGAASLLAQVQGNPGNGEVCSNEALLMGAFFLGNLTFVLFGLWFVCFNTLSFTTSFRY